MKFSSFYAGNYLSSVDQFLQRMDAKFSSMDASSKATGASVPFLTIDEIGHSVESVLNAIEYANGEVDLERICSILSIELVRSGEEIKADDGQIILGVASFDQKSIQINLNGDGARERFTIGHELGHFCLRHDRYLRSETLVETDLIAVGDQERSFNFERLEIQANMFASDLLLPRKQFFRKVEEFRSLLDITDRGHGYIYVDDQPCNLQDYYKLLTFLKMEFGVSKQAIEVKLKRLGMLNDQRNKIGSPFNFVLGVGRL